MSANHPLVHSCTCPDARARKMASAITARITGTGLPLRRISAAGQGRVTSATPPGECDSAQTCVGFSATILLDRSIKLVSDSGSQRLTSCCGLTLRKCVGSYTPARGAVRQRCDLSRTTRKRAQMSFPQAVAAELGGIVASDDRASQVTSVGHKGPIAYRRVCIRRPSAHGTRPTLR